MTTDTVTCVIRGARAAESTKVCSRERAPPQNKRQQNLHRNNQHACACTCITYSICIYYRRIRAEIVCIPDALIKRNQVSPLLAFSGLIIVTWIFTLPRQSKQAVTTASTDTFRMLYNMCRYKCLAIVNQLNLDKREALW